MSSGFENDPDTPRAAPGLGSLWGSTGPAASSRFLTEPTIRGVDSIRFAGLLGSLARPTLRAIRPGCRLIAESLLEPISITLALSPTRRLLSDLMGRALVPSFVSELDLKDWADDRSTAASISVL